MQLPVISLPPFVSLSLSIVNLQTFFFAIYKTTIINIPPPNISIASPIMSLIQKITAKIIATPAVAPYTALYHGNNFEKYLSNIS